MFWTEVKFWSVLAELLPGKRAELRDQKNREV